MLFEARLNECLSCLSCLSYYFEGANSHYIIINQTKTLRRERETANHMKRNSKPHVKYSKMSTSRRLPVEAHVSKLAQTSVG